MNTLDYYRTCEKDDPVRADPHEGLMTSWAASGARLLRNDVEIGTLTGPITQTDQDALRINVYCLHTRRQSEYGKVVQFTPMGFGDSCVLFLDYVEFLRRVERAADALGHSIRYGLVEYVDPDRHRGPMGIFRKYNRFESQREHRIAILPGTGTPLSMRLGSLRDITTLEAIS
jgi:hypothetical protein